MAFSHPIDDRYFEDYVEGDVHEFGPIAVELDEVLSFARRFDPQTMHVDPEGAKKLLAAHERDLVKIPIGDPGVIRDIDTPEDLLPPVRV